MEPNAIPSDTRIENEPQPTISSLDLSSLEQTTGQIQQLVARKWDLNRVLKLMKKGKPWHDIASADLKNTYQPRDTPNLDITQVRKAIASVDSDLQTKIDELVKTLEKEHETRTGEKISAEALELTLKKRLKNAGHEIGKSLTKAQSSVQEGFRQAPTIANISQKAIRVPAQLVVKGVREISKAYIRKHKTELDIAYQSGKGVRKAAQKIADQATSVKQTLASEIHAHNKELEKIGEETGEGLVHLGQAVSETIGPIVKEPIALASGIIKAPIAIGEGVINATHELLRTKPRDEYPGIKRDPILAKHRFSSIKDTVTGHGRAAVAKTTKCARKISQYAIAIAKSVPTQLLGAAKSVEAHLVAQNVVENIPGLKTVKSLTPFILAGSSVLQQSQLALSGRTSTAQASTNIALTATSLAAQEMAKKNMLPALLLGGIAATAGITSYFLHNPEKKQKQLAASISQLGKNKPIPATLHSLFRELTQLKMHISEEHLSKTKIGKDVVTSVAAYGAHKFAAQAIELAQNTPGRAVGKSIIALGCGTLSHFTGGQGLSKLLLNHQFRAIQPKLASTVVSEAATVIGQTILRRLLFKKN